MSNIDDRLRATLRRHDPPPGLAERILARTRESSAVQRPPMLALRPRPLAGQFWRRLGVIAATLALVFYSGMVYQHAREERAARQAELALRIAAEKLNLTRDRIFKNISQEDYR